MIKIIAVGKIRQDYLKEGIEYYLKQIPHKVEIIEVKDESSIEKIELEEKRILAKIKQSDYVVLLAIDGKMYTSESFSSYIEKTLNEKSNITFIIGGSYGVTNKIYERANDTVSFSKMTFPHQLMRLILVEQVYRSFMIQVNHPYHK